MTQPALAAVIDPRDFARILRAARGFDKQLYTAIRKRLRKAADPAVQDIRSTILAGPSKGNTATKLRQHLAANTKVSISTGRLPGVTISTSGAGLPSKNLARAYNKSAFRHPVFGNREVWVSEKGHPYFDRVYQHKPAMRQAVLDALVDALKSMETA